MVLTDLQLKREQLQKYLVEMRKRKASREERKEILKEIAILDLLSGWKTPES